MQKLKHPLGFAGLAATLFTLLAVISGTLFYHGLSAKAAPAVAAPKVHFISKAHLPYLNTKTIHQNGNVLFSCQSNGASPRCYAPYQIRQAYDIQRVLDAGYTGKGSTIVIVDAFQSPTIVKDLALFNSTFNLHTSKLNIIAPDGLTPFNSADPNQVGWSAEISLDVEWAHAVAPSATIDLVLAKSNADVDILSVTKYAVDHQLGGVISQSFGEAESCADPVLLAQEHAVFQKAAKEGITVFASSGDQGAAQPTCDGSSYFLSASTPASDPLVTAVGGTSLNAGAHTGKYIGEAAWNDQYGASGGGYSTIYKRPAYQQHSIIAGANKGRGVPDVAYNADVNGGVLVAWGVPAGVGHFFIFGGTSAGSPQWAGIIALVDQLVGGNEGFINGILYQGFGATPASFFHDITYGTNTFTGAGSNGKTVTINGYNTQKGWDAVTGLGSLIVGNTFFGPSAMFKQGPRPSDAAGL
ncbi:MAG: S53 family peptidase [Ktedonobacteraceae bacterium]